MKQNSVDPDDPRVTRTRKTLHQALLELAHERDLDSISVADVTQRAQVNRATFYSHYKSLDELLEVALELELQELVAAVSSHDLEFATFATNAAPDFIITAIRKLEARFPVYRRVFSANGSARVVHSFRQRVAEELFLRMKANGRKGAIPAQVQATALAGAVVGVLTHWFETKPKATPSRVAGWLWQLVARTMRDPDLIGADSTRA